MSEESGKTWLDAAEATLALGDRLFWLSLVVMVIGSGAWHVIRLQIPEDDIPPLALNSKQQWQVDPMPTATIVKRSR